MNVKQLIKKLKTLPSEYDLRLINIGNINEEYVNIWLTDIEVSYKGNSGYETNGEVRLIGTE